ncbi:hypothetical protein GCM10011351_25310 [Paraliobacillus quinghaiensis]|uniref:Uncharacterized protein n=1 Tax=Paraliobacillus quinghaiensis TaxID=470815 RepID=A0A917TU48_9BACI|nr:hypothetical protein GCM10011351_25310 [Paraliobacillus quinghaiensis]
MVRLFTEQLHISYGEDLIVKDLTIEIPIKKLQPLLVQTDVGNQLY